MIFKTLLVIWWYFHLNCPAHGRFLGGQATKLTKSRGSGIRYGNFQCAIKQ
jgi:hypothetical protein